MSRASGFRRDAKIATFNIRGPKNQVKKEEVIEDLKLYGVEICCLQETKITEEVDEEIGGYRLININSEQQSYGNGFLISPKWKHSVYRFWKESDRIAILQLDLDPDRYEVKDHTDLKMTLRKIKPAKPEKLMTVINVYAPHTGRLNESLEELEEMYKKLDTILLDLSRTKDLFCIAGDFNASQFVSITAFRNSARHIKTLESTRTVDGKITKIFNQIDYIICSQRIKHKVKNARS